MKLILLALVVFIGIWSSEAYQCYSCNSATDANCGDPFDKNKAGAGFKVNAADNQRCQKSKIPGGIISRNLVLATACPKGDNGCVSVDVPLIGKSTTCCCNSDLCNGVSSVRQQPLFVLGIISALVILVRHYF